MSKLKQWFSFSEGADYKGPEPFFFNVADKPWVALLEKNYSVIQNELHQVIQTQNKDIIPYYNQTLASAPASWTIFPLIMWGRRNQKNCAQVKETMKIIDQINGVTTCSFSILKPHTKIKPHFGDTNVMYRCHLTLKSSGTKEEIGMRVGNEIRTWETGKLFSFCDAFNHEVWNNTDQERWVLIIDVLREEFERDKKQICKNVNATMWWQLKFQKRYLIGHLPNWLRRSLMKATAVFMQVD
ncbi:MAG: hypothetical protein K0S26_1149 [Bacteroidota bacterium]|nr:hypothetical protein [Bacteroidota bacterium]